MSISAPKLTWCIARLGSDLNWWVEETSDPVHWDTDALSIIDPKQLRHLLDTLNILREYGLKPDLFESAFYAFRIEKDLGKGRLRLVRCEESLLGSEEMLFALPNSLDEDKSTYADFLDHITKLRVKMLNDMISFEQKLTIEEIEEDIREREQADYLEGKSIHSFKEIIDVVEYVPDGYELDSDDESPGKKSNDEEDIPELGDDYELEEEDIEEDETMKWDEDAEGFHLEDHEDDNSDGLDFSKDDDDDDLEDEEEEEEDLTPRRSKARK